MRYVPRNHKDSYLTEFTFLSQVLSRWNPDEIIVEEYERGDGNKVITYNFDNAVVAQCLTRPDNRLIRMLWPAYRPN